MAVGVSYGEVEDAAIDVCVSVRNFCSSHFRQEVISNHLPILRIFICLADIIALSCDSWCVLKKLTVLVVRFKMELSMF